MAKILITFVDETANTTDIYEHTMTDATLNRIIEVGRRIYGTKGPTPNTGIQLVNKNITRKRFAKDAVKKIKDLVIRYETESAMANIAPVDTTEV